MSSFSAAPTEEPQQLEAEHADLTDLSAVIPVADAVPAVITSQTSKSLMDASFAAMKKQLVPGLILQALALFLIILYYASDAARASFDQLADLKARGGYIFSGISTSIAGGVLPTLVTWLRVDLAKRKEARLKELTQGLEVAPVATNATSVETNAGDAMLQMPDEPFDSLSTAPAAAAASEVEVTQSADGALTVKELSGLTRSEELCWNIIYWFEHGSASTRIDAAAIVVAVFFALLSRSTVLFAASPCAVSRWMHGFVFKP